MTKATALKHADCWGMEEPCVYGHLGCAHGAGGLCHNEAASLAESEEE